MSNNALKCKIPSAFTAQGRLGDFSLRSYFSPPFLVYEETLTANQEWDIAATLNILPPPPCRIMDLGCGSGRLTIPLAKRGYSVLAVDDSASALGILSSRLRRYPDELSVTVLQQNVLSNVHIDIVVDVVLLGNISINLFAADTIDILLSFIYKKLIPGGAFCFGTLTAASIADFKKYNGSVAQSLHSDKYTDEDGIERIIWMYTEFDEPTDEIHRAWFLDLIGSKIYSHRYNVAVLRQRLWTQDSLKAHLTSNGFKIVNTELAGIKGGGAGGQLVEFCKYIK